MIIRLYADGGPMLDRLVVDPRLAKADPDSPGWREVVYLIKSAMQQEVRLREEGENSARK